ncbi:TPA: mechanosensitive ion channel family protein [Candidatus Bathyarchaeota archaeon]|nr:mechanosensitive ion channel family protein [Candidatus Bathyarchaeota archaeon]
MSSFFAVMLVSYLLYRLTAKRIASSIVGSRGNEGDVAMIVGFWKIILGTLAPMVGIAFFFPEYWILPTFLGTFGGLFLGWAMQPIVTSIAVWVVISIKRPFKLGDRVQIPTLGVKGDVIEVSPLYTVLNQVGGAVEAEEAVDRSVLIPNSVLFSNPVVNYTPNPVTVKKGDWGEGVAYALDEVTVRITYDTDWLEAERILLSAANEVTKDIISATGKDPYIRSDMYDYGVLLRLRYMTYSTDRPRMKYEIEKKVVKAFQDNPLVDFAIPYIYSAKMGEALEEQSRGEKLCA